MKESFAARLRRLREEAGMSLADLASGAGVSEMAVRNWEAGRADPRRASLEGLAKALKVKPSVLLGE